VELEYLTKDSFWWVLIVGDAWRCRSSPAQ
jgi:hypothetical protein